MKIIICGAGQVGYGIAECLAREQNDVTVVDALPRLVRAVSNALDVRGIVGYGSYPDVLRQAGARDADMLIAATSTDEVNMVACQIAHSLFEIPTKIARVRAQDYLELEWRNLFSRDNLPIDVVISPEIAVGDMVMRRLALPGAFEAVSFADDKITMLGIRLREDCPVVDTTLRQLTELFPDLKTTVAGIVRDDKLFVPRGTDQMFVGDNVYMIADSSHIERILGIFGHDEKPARRIIIAGGGHIGLYVAQKLEQCKSRHQVKLIEPNHERATMAAKALQRTVVLNGSTLEHSLLREAGAGETEAFIALTNDDKVNILASVMAKQEGARRTLSLVSGTDFTCLFESLNIDAYISPRMVTVSTILRHVRKGRIRGVHPICNGQGEVLEAEALETSPVVGCPLREADLPGGVRIGALIRDDTTITPTGDTEIRPHDRIVIFALAEMVREVEHLFRVSPDYL